FREFLRQTIVEQIGIGASEKRGLGEGRLDAPTPRRPDALLLAGRSTSLAEILQMIKVLGQCLDEMRWNDNPQLVLELYALRLSQPFVNAGELLKRLEALEGRVGGSEGRSTGESPGPVVKTISRATSVSAEPSQRPPNS